MMFQGSKNMWLSSRQLEKKLTSTKELLDHYYSSFTVVYIPRKGRYQEIGTQLKRLYGIIKKKCTDAYQTKKTESDGTRIRKAPTVPQFCIWSLL